MEDYEVTCRRSQRQGRKNIVGTVISSLGHMMVLIASSLRCCILGWRGKEIVWLFFVYHFYATWNLLQASTGKFPLNYVSINLWTVKSMYRKKWKTHKCYWKNYRESQKVGCYQLSLTPHISVYTSLQLWQRHSVCYNPSSFRKLGIWYRHGSQRTQSYKTPQLKRAGRCTHCILGWTEKDRVRAGREFSRIPEQASQVLGVYWPTQHPWFWQNVLLVAWHESCLNRLKVLWSSKRRALHPCSSKSLLLSLECLQWELAAQPVFLLFGLPSKCGHC